MPMVPYAFSKLASEQYAMAYAPCYDLEVLPFRFFNVFGGQMPGHAYAVVIPVFVDDALGGLPLPVNGDGHKTRDSTFVGTSVETLAQAFKNRVTAPPMDLAFGTRTTLNELIRLIEEQQGTVVDVRYREPRLGDVPHSQADSSRPQP
jgi:UDP-glucose 4-epimerase